MKIEQLIIEIWNLFGQLVCGQLVNCLPAGSYGVPTNITKFVR